MVKLQTILKKYQDIDDVYIAHGNDENDIIIVDSNGELIDRFQIGA